MVFHLWPARNDRSFLFRDHIAPKTEKQQHLKVFSLFLLIEISWMFQGMQANAVRNSCWFPLFRCIELLYPGTLSPWRKCWCMSSIAIPAMFSTWPALVRAVQALPEPEIECTVLWKKNAVNWKAPVLWWNVVLGHLIREPYCPWSTGIFRHLDWIKKPLCYSGFPCTMTASGSIPWAEWLACIGLLRFSWFCLVYHNGSSIHIGFVQGRDRFFSFFIFHHFNESEAFGTTAELVDNDVCTWYFAELFECFTKVGIICAVIKIANVDIHNVS